MLKKIESVLKEVREDSPKTAEELEKFRINHLGKNGTMNRFFEEFKQTPNTEKKELGQALNKLKKAIQEKLNEKKYSFSENFRQPSNIDLSKPVDENTAFTFTSSSVVAGQHEEDVLASDGTVVAAAGSDFFETTEVPITNSQFLANSYANGSMKHF